MKLSWDVKPLLRQVLGKSEQDHLWVNKDYTILYLLYVPQITCQT